MIEMMSTVFLIEDPLVLQDGLLQFHFGGRWQPVLVNGAPINEFLPGWRSRALFTGFAPIFLLELEHETGERVTWFLGHRMERIADRLASFPPDVKLIFKQRCDALLNRLLYQLLHAPVPSLESILDGYLQICSATRHDIAIWCYGAVSPTGCLFLVEDLPSHSLVVPSVRDGLIPIDKEWLVAGLSIDWQSAIGGFVRSGQMLWPSPIDGAPLRVQGGLVIDDIHFAYRVTDETHGLVFFVLVAEHHSNVAGLWFPSLGLQVCPDRGRLSLSHHMLRHLPWWVLCHVSDYGRLVLPALARGATRFASVMRSSGLHIGHQLWNELTGIETAVHSHPDALPDWLVFGAELFGPIDVLFPALAGRVRRDAKTLPELIENAYRSDLFVLRITSERVSVSLRTRIAAYAAQTAAGRETEAVIRQTLPATGVTRPLVLLIGLRVENRTVADLAGLLERLIISIAERHPGATIILDAHNSIGPDRQVIRSHGECGNGAQPINVERELVAKARTTARGVDVCIIDTIGQPIATSLAWCAEVDCFVSIWGASLAKYRWVCNRPGYILTSRSNLESRTDLHIYDSPLYLEAPTLLRFVPEELVVDVGQATALLPMPGNPLFDNFELDYIRLLQEILNFIDTVRPPVAVCSISD